MAQEVEAPPWEDFKAAAPAADAPPWQDFQPDRAARKRALQGEQMAERRSGQGADFLLGAADAADYAVDTVSKMNPLTILPRLAWNANELTKPKDQQRAFPLDNGQTVIPVEDWTPQMVRDVSGYIGGPFRMDVGPASETAAGALNAANDFSKFFLTPEGISVLGAGAAPKAAQAALAAGFAGQMASGVEESAAHAGTASVEGTREEATRALLGAGANVAFAGGIPLGAIKAAQRPHPLLEAARMLAEKVNDPAVTAKLERAANELAIDRSNPENRYVINAETGTPEFAAKPPGMFTAEAKPWEEFRGKLETTTAETTAIRPEAMMETRRAAELGLQREPAVDPDLADTMAAIRAGYVPTQEAETSNVQRPTSTGEAGPVGFNAANIEKVLGVTPEQAAATEAIADAMGLDKSKISLSAGGTVGKDALYQEQALAFHSQLTKTIGALPQETMTVQQARALIEKGSKKAEIEQQGIFTDPLSPLFGKDNAAKVTRKELLDYSTERAAKVEDVVLGEKELNPYEKFVSKMERKYGVGYDTEKLTLGERMTQENAWRLANSERPVMGESDTHFSSLQLPGADEGSYREMFVTWPVKPNVQRLGNGKWTVDGKEVSRSVAIDAAETGDRWNDGHGQYSDIANPIVRIRRNIRTDANGKRIYFIEEMQGPNPENQAKMPDYLRKRIYEIGMKRALRDAVDQGADAIAWTTGEQQAERYNLSKHFKEITVQPTKSGFNVEGYDHKGTLVFSEGGLPAEKLESAIGKELAERVLKYKGATSEQINQAEQRVRSTAKDSSEFWEATDAFDALKKGHQSFTGLDLKVGGEGLKNLYDRTLPSIANDLAKKFGGRVGAMDVVTKSEGSGEWDVEPSVKGFRVFKEDGTIDSYHKQKSSAEARSRELNSTPVTESVHSLPIPDALKQQQRAVGNPLFQGKKGAVEITKEGRALIHALDAPDVSTGVHELAHIARRTVLNEAGGFTKEQVKHAQDWSGAKNGVWDRAADEKFARGFERYLRDGKAPTATLKTIFAKFKAWLSQIYTKLNGSALDLKISPQMRGVYDTLVQRSDKIRDAKSSGPGDAPTQEQSKPAQPGGKAPGTVAEPLAQIKVRKISRGNSLASRFGRETEVVGPDILDWIDSTGGMLSKSSARGKGVEYWNRVFSQYDDSAPLQSPHHNVVYRGQRTPDLVAQAAYEAGKLKEPSVNELWDAMDAASKSRKGVTSKGGTAADAKALENYKADIEDHEAWVKATTKEGKGKFEVSNEMLGVGDVLDVDGERVEVIGRDPQTGDLTLKDGKKFGRQVLEDGRSIYVENWVEKPQKGASPAQSTPQLRPGEQGTGDLLQGKDAPFNVAGETFVDQGRVAAEQAAADQRAAEAKAIADKQQMDMFGGSPDINSGALGEVGMGGAKPGEFGKATTATGIKNATVDAERAKRGLPAAMEAARREFPGVWDEAMARLDSDPTYVSDGKIIPGVQDRLIDELREKPRPASAVENAMLLHRQIDLQNEYGRATRELNFAAEDSAHSPERGELVPELKLRVARLSDALLDLYNINKMVGTENALGLVTRKMLAYEDFTLAKMETELRAAKGGAPLSEAERAKIVELQGKIEEAQRRYDEVTAQRDEALAQQRAAEAVAEMERNARREPTYDPRILRIADEIVSKVEAAAKKNRPKLNEMLARMSSGLDPELLYYLGVEGAAKIMRKGLDGARFAAEMTAEFGEKLAPYMKEIWEKANLHLNNEGAKYGDKAEPVKRLLRKRDEAGRRENVVEGLQKAKAEGQPIELQGDYIRRLAESFVRAGVRGREALIDAVHEVLASEFDPEMTRRETMDAISGYGKFKALNPDEVKAQLRDLRGQMQQLAKLEDIQAKKPLLKTGVERRSQSDEERRLIQQVNEAKRRHGVVVSDPARQLKSALDSVKTRLKHSIADLEYQIATKQRIVKAKSATPFDSETRLLEARRDVLKAQFDEIFSKDITDEQRVAIAERALERSIAEYEERIKNKDTTPAKAKWERANTPKLEALRARRDAMRQEWQEMRNLSEVFQQQRAESALAREKSNLEAGIAERERKLREGDVATGARPIDRPASDPAIEALKQRRDYLNRKLAEARKNPEAVREAERLARQLAAMEKAIAVKLGKLASGDLSSDARARALRPLADPALEAAQLRLDDLNRKLAEARRGPKKSPEEIALASLKTRLRNMEASYADRLARKDFTPRPRREIRLDPEASAAKADAELAKRAWHRALLEERIRNLTRSERIWAYAKEAVNLPRNVLSSWDVSAVLRQGGFIGIGNPARAMRGLLPMFRALGSERRAVEVEQEILSRPNATLYARAKLYLAPLDSLHLSAMEEQMMSRIAGKITGLRASNRAYITFLNRLRADSFDTMKASIESRGVSLNDAELKAVANYINVASGRGGLGHAAPAAEVLATAFFSPRLMASRFQLLAAQPLFGGSARTRRAVAMEYGKFLVGMAVIYELGVLSGATVETDPRSSDFGKLRFGNTRVDVLAGLGQNTVLLSRLSSGETKTMSGELRPIRGDRVPYGTGTSADVIGRFLRSKLSPVVGAAVDVASGKNVVGESVTPSATAMNLLTPLSMRDIYDVMIEQGVPAGTALWALSLFGFGVQQFPPPPPPKHPRRQFSDPAR